MTIYRIIYCNHAFLMLISNHFTEGKTFIADYIKHKYKYVAMLNGIVCFSSILDRLKDALLKIEEKGRKLSSFRLQFSCSFARYCFSSPRLTSLSIIKKRRRKLSLPTSCFLSTDQISYQEMLHCQLTNANNVIHNSSYTVYAYQIKCGYLV